MRVLVLDGHSRAAVETLQSLGRVGAVLDVAAASADALSFRSRYPARRLLQPAQTSTADFLDWLRRMDCEREYTLVVPTTEVSLLGLNTLPASDALRRRAVLPPRHAVDVALDKERTWRLAAELRIPVPRSVTIERLDQLPPCDAYPVALKPTRSQVVIDDRMITVSAGLARDSAERVDFLRRWVPRVPVQQQEYVPGHGVGVELLYDRGRKLWHFLHERIHEMPLTGGASTYRRSMPVDLALLAAAQTLLDELQWHGAAMVEFRVNRPGEFWLMEINPRLWGSLALAVDAGVNFPRGLLSLAMGQSPGPQPSYRSHYYSRDLPNDLRWFKANAAADRRDPLLLTRSPVLSLLELSRPLAGRESWDHFDWRDPCVTVALVAGAIQDTTEVFGRMLRRCLFALTSRHRHRRVLGRALGRSNGRLAVLFLCYGNICRSPFAERLTAECLPGHDISSAGFHDREGRCPPAHLLAAAESMGVDMSGTRSVRVTRRQIDGADLVLVMDTDNYRAVATEFPHAIPRTTFLGLFAPRPALDITDPYAATEAEAHRILGQIEASVAGLVAWLMARHGSSIANRDVAT